MTAWDEKVGQIVTVEGRLELCKMGWLLTGAHGSIWLDTVPLVVGQGQFGDSLRSPMTGMNGTTVRVTGTVVERQDKPVFIEKQGEPPVAGIPCPEGTNLKEARKRHLLTDIAWSLV